MGEVLFVDAKRKLRLEIPNGNLTVRFSHRMRSVLNSAQNFTIVKNHLVKSQQKGPIQNVHAGDMKPPKACRGCSIPVITTLMSNLRIITKGRNFRLV